ncbi:hemophore-related protein [Nocardia sp. NPDC049149]|uniref:hemophore-related protein n=1 Tax=Nocardia sp. NPDC049149 TaxID=3364315 RepID=UPI003714689C
MTMRKTRYTIAALAIGGFSTAAALFGSGAASASLVDDMAPLLTTTCSFSQIDAAIHQVAPEAAARLDAAPIQKAALEMTISQPAEQRAAMYKMLADNGNQVSTMDGFNPEAGPVMRQAAATCHTF